MKLPQLFFTLGLLFPGIPMTSLLAQAAEAPAASDPAAKPAASEEGKTEPKPNKPAIKQLSETEFELGQIWFNGKTREVRIPALVNATGDRDIIEYVLVHEGGKTHESLLKTPISPLDLQVVLKLLSFKTGNGNLFDNFNPPGALPDPQPLGDAIDVFVTWPGADENPICSLIRDFGLDETMENIPWNYNGSEIIKGVFQAETEGSIISLYLDTLAMFNLGHPRAGDDENWFPISTSIPAYETAVTVILRPAAAEVDAD